MSKPGIVLDKDGADIKLRVLQHTHEATGEQLLHFLGQVKKDAQRNATGRIVGKKTISGNLGLSLGVEEPKSTGRGWRGAVGSGIGKRSMPYARILDLGGTIRAKRKPFLVFRLPDGSWRRCKQVKIPKFRWFSKAVEDNLPLLRKNMSEKEILRLAKRLA